MLTEKKIEPHGVCKFCLEPFNSDIEHCKKCNLCTNCCVCNVTKAKTKGRHMGTSIDEVCIEK